MKKDSAIILIGYSGHAYVVYDIFLSMNYHVLAYTDIEEKRENPFHLEYLGSEKNSAVLAHFRKQDYFIAIGNNSIRSNIHQFVLKATGREPLQAIHKSAVVSGFATLNPGCMVGPNAVINARAKIGNGTICNTSVIIEHECTVGNFSHIAPGAVLAGNVTVGHQTFIGANAVVKEGVTIGNQVTVGAGSVILKDIPDGQTIVGNPGRRIKNK